MADDLEKRIEELKKLDGARTQRKWKCERNIDDYWMIVDDFDRELMAADYQNVNNLEYACAAANLLPDLLAERERMKKEIGELQRQADCQHREYHVTNAVEIEHGVYRVENHCIDCGHRKETTEGDNYA